MSTGLPTLTPIGGEPDPSRTAEVDESAFENSPRWPVTKLAGLSLMGLLLVCLVAPATVAGVGGGRLFALVLPAILATVAARVLFEAIDPGRRGLVRSHALPAVLAAAVATLLLSGAAVIVGLHWSLVTAIATGALAAGALATAGALRDVEIRVRLSLRRVFFVGSADTRRDLEQELRRRSDATFVGAATLGAQLDPALLVQAIRESHATVLVIDLDAMREARLVEAAGQLNLGGLHVRDLVSYYESEFKKVPLGELSPTWFLFDIAPIHRRPLTQAVRRVGETVIAALLLLATAPLLAAAVVAIRVTSPGPALYRQRRVGRGGAQFTLLKLRTMTLADDEPHWAPSQSHRVTRVGRILRRFRLDELPQLWNVIRGDLALVGPRPEQVAIVDRLEREIPFYSARHCIRPGLTGWAQVNLGYAGSVEGTVAKLQRDLYYIKHAGLRLDALILWMTLKTVVAGRG
jgi:lipopolysaccharide/colanic/teichoic acid biosynthesis glycosyltransferase